VFVHNFDDVTPPARYGGVAWTGLRVEESLAAGGPFTEIDVQTIAADPTPETPNAIDVEVTTATLERGWFRFRFDTGAGTPTSPYTAAVFSPAAVPATGRLTLAELKERIDKELTDDDDVLAAYLEAAFQQAQAPPPYGCGRLLVPDPASDLDEPVTRSIRAGGRRRVAIPDARAITKVVVDDDVVTDYEVFERNGHIVQLQLPRVASAALTSVDPTPKTIEITGRFGFIEIPSDLREAIYLLAARAFHERDAAYADQVAIAEGAGVQTYYRQLPPRTKLAFATYSLPAGMGLVLT
jgi:hypothetical protein